LSFSIIAAEHVGAKDPASRSPVRRLRKPIHQEELPPGKGKIASYV
jgi:hypothetical protein